MNVVSRSRVVWSAPNCEVAPHLKGHLDAPIKLRLHISNRLNALIHKIQCINATLLDLSPHSRINAVTKGCMKSKDAGLLCLGATKSLLSSA